MFARSWFSTCLSKHSSNLLDVVSFCWSTSGDLKLDLKLPFGSGLQFISSWAKHSTRITHLCHFSTRKLLLSFESTRQQKKIRFLWLQLQLIRPKETFESICAYEWALVWFYRIVRKRSKFNVNKRLGHFSFRSNLSAIIKIKFSLGYYC